MQLRLIRNATLRLTYAGHVILIDPYFAPKHSRGPLVGKSKNPMVGLPLSVEEILTDVELVIVSHLHFDHFDPTAQEAIPKDWRIICQPGDETKIAEHGFTDVTPLDNSITWNEIKITRTIGQHGTGKWLERMGSVMGFVLEADDEPTVYWCGDTIWIDAVAETIQQFQPDVIITHSAGASFEANSPIVMDAEQTIQVCEAKPEATVIAVHLDTLDHATVSREDLRAAANQANISETRLLIPLDGETLVI